MKSFGVFLLLCITLLFIGNRVYDANREPEITGSFSIMASASPKKANIIELQEMYGKSKELYKKDKKERHAGGEFAFHSFRIYYGEYGSLLESYKELKDIRMSNIDHFEVVWKDDNQAIINVIPPNRSDENVAIETYEFDFPDQTLTKQED